MKRAHYNTISNDNEPLDRFPSGDAIGFRALVLDKQREYEAIKSDDIVYDLTSELKTGHISLYVSLAFWLGSLGVCLWGFYTSQPIGVRLVATMALIWTALWTSYLTENQDKPRLGEFAVLSALGGFISILLTASTQLGLPLDPADGLCLFGTASLLVSILIRSRIALVASISACIIWAALYFDGYIIPSAATLALPAILCLQIFMAAKLKSRSAIMGSVIAGYIWLGGYLLILHQTGQLSSLYLAGAAFMIAAVHYQTTKAADDEGLRAMELHLLFAWCLGTLSLIAIQHSILKDTQAVWVNYATTTPLVKVLWALGAVISLGVIFIAGLVRNRHKRMSVPAVISMTGLYALAPLYIWFEEPLAQQFPFFTGLDVNPSLAMFIGGAVFASAFMFTFNNVRRKRIVISIFGLIAVGIQADLTMDRTFFTHTDIIMLFCGFMAGLAITTSLVRVQLKKMSDQASSPVLARS